MTGLSGVLGALLVGLVVTPPYEGGPSRPQPKPREPDYSRRDPKLVKEQVEQIVQLVRKLDAIPVFSKRKIETLFGVALTTARSEPQYPNDYEAALPSGPFKRVTLHHSGQKAKKKFWIVTLDVRDGVILRRQDFDEEVIGPRTGSNPNDPTGSSYWHGVERPGKSTNFVFKLWTGLFDGVGFHRGAAADD